MHDHGQWQRKATPRGSFYIALGDEASTAITTGGTYVKAAGTTTGQLGIDFTHTNGRLTYNGAKDHFHVSASATVTVDLAGGIVHLRIAKGGNTIAGSEQHVLIVNSSDRVSMTCSWCLELAPDDYIEVFATTDTGQDSRNITLEHLVLTIW